MLVTTLCINGQPLTLPTPIRAPASQPSQHKEPHQ